MTSREPVTGDDKVNDVLARGESLLDVFVRQAPHFAKLRNAAMRRVMTRLLTVEQAARTANVPVERLLQELNAALGIADERQNASAAEPRVGGPDAARHPIGAPIVVLDVREDLRSGREPFSRIMAAVAALLDHEVLEVQAIFEPVPLFAALGRRGFAHESLSRAPDDWSAWFWRAARETQPGGAQADAAVRVQNPGAERATWLDVRGSMPPEPMMRTLAALESLARGGTLVQLNDRVPHLLLPLLHERGFQYEVDDSQPDRVLVRIWRAE